MSHALLSFHATPLAPGRQCPVRAGLRIDQIVSPAARGVMVQVDGQWILREQWAHTLLPGQHLQVHCLPAGNDGRKALRTILTVAALVVAPELAGHALLETGAVLGSYSTYLAVTTVALITAINVLVPPVGGSFGGLATAGSPTYNTALSGNRAALYEPIPVQYGHMRPFPPFAADPYSTFDNDTNDQYFHALLCLGQGEYEVHRVDIDDTNIDHFADVQYTVLPPGEAPTLVLPTVVVAPEVADIALNAGRATPAIAACRGGQLASSIGVDVVFPGGLGDASGGSVTTYAVGVRVDWRPLDQWGVPIGAWATLGTESISAASTEPVRRSYLYSLGGSYRPEVRLVRTTPRDEDPLVRNDAFWTGLRAYLATSAPLDANATHVEIRMRATEQLNGLTQRRLAVRATRKVHTWDAETGWSAEPSATRSIAWAICDKLRNSDYGDGLPDERIDLESFAALDAVWAARQDRLDVVFDATLDSDEADQLMARAGRARCIWRQGVRSIVRDAPQTLPAAAYSGRDIVPGSVSLRLNTNAAQVPDAVIVEYYSHASWDWERVTCPAPGVVTPTRPQVMRLPGVTGAKHAEREGLYEAAVRVARRKFAGFTTEAQGRLPSYGSLVVASLPLRNWGQHGDVVSFDSGTLEMVLTEPPQWVPAENHYITLVRPNGQPTDGILCTEGADAYTVVLDEAPDFDPVTDDARRERTRFIFGATAAHRREMLVLAIRPQELRDDGALLVDMLLVNEEPSVHTVDEDLLPVGEEVQDPIESPNEDDPPGEIIVAYLTARTVSDDIPAGGGTYGTTLRLKTDGVLQFIKTATGPGATTTIANQWILGSPVDPGDTATFEARATLLSGSLTSGTTGSWLLMDTQREWYASGSGDGTSTYATLRLEIRDGSGLVQATANIIIGGSAAEFGE